ncbi:unnamed protein product [Coffea canephora]|uniref:Uncharacterized protein n=1 Tax=Coffea canephora TaxID=49390 RepID=A0A068V730_COFCA|nr:unnamed protein product [Coffea canephora]
MLRACSADGGRKRKREPKAAVEEQGKRNEIPALALKPQEISCRRVNFILDNAAIKKILVKKRHCESIGVILAEVESSTLCTRNLRQQRSTNGNTKV